MDQQVAATVLGIEVHGRLPQDLIQRLGRNRRYAGVLGRARETSPEVAWDGPVFEAFEQGVEGQGGRGATRARTAPHGDYLLCTLGSRLLAVASNRLRSESPKSP